MPGTTKGGRLSYKTIVARDPEHYRRIGRIGGKTPTKTPKGFATMDKSKLIEVSSKGGRIGKRRGRGTHEHIQT